MAETIVINIKTFKGSYKYIGRNIIFGNPFIIRKDGTRKEVIEKHKAYFKAKLKGPEFKKTSLKIKRTCPWMPLQTLTMPWRCYSQLS